MDEAIEFVAAQAVRLTKFVGQEARGFVDVVDELCRPGRDVGGMMIDDEPGGFVEAGFEAEVSDPGGAFLERALFPVLIMESEQARARVEKALR